MRVSFTTEANTDFRRKKIFNIVKVFIVSGNLVFLFFLKKTLINKLLKVNNKR